MKTTSWLRQFRQHVCLRQKTERQKRRTPLHHSKAAIEVLEERALLTDFAAVLPNEFPSNHELFPQTLRGAIAQANSNPGADRVILLPGFTYAISSQLELTDDVEIYGNGSEALGPQLFTITAGNGDHRVLDVDDGTTAKIDVTINGVTITGGGDGVTDLQGAGIFSAENLTIRNAHVTGNDAGGALGGGVMAFDGNLTVVNSVFSGNEAEEAGAIWTQGSGELKIINSTISGNSASHDGGGIVALSDTTIRNTTITGNRSDDDGTGGGTGGGIWGNPNIVTLHNTIAAGNFRGTGSTPSDIVNSLRSESSFNLVGAAGDEGNLTHDPRDGSGDGRGNIVGNNGTGTLPIASILNTTLQLNGGINQTHALVAGSPAIDAGDDGEALNENDATLATDQRVFPDVLHPRIRNGNLDATPTVDIGSFEAVLLGPYVVDADSDVVDGDYSAGNLSLREVVDNHNLSMVPGTIGFNLPAASTITLGGDELRLTNDVTIDGAGASNLTINGNENSRVFRFTDIDATVRNLAITGGDAFDSSDNDDSFSNIGGGILNERGMLTTQEVRIHNNRAQYGAGVTNWRGTARVERSTIDTNTATSNGAGLYNWGDGGGAVATILNSTFSANNAGNDGGAIYNWAGDTSADLTVNNVTITQNTSSAIRNAGGNIMANSSIIADNGAVDITGSVSGSNNLIGVDTNLSGISNQDSGNQIGTSGSPLDPLLGPLQINGGTTPTHALMSGSTAAIDKGLAISEVVVTGVDQRGTGFDRVVDGDGNGTDTVDIGAFEFEPAAAEFLVTSPTGLTQNQRPTVSWTAVDGALSYNVYLNIDNGGGNVFQRLQVSNTLTSLEIDQDLEFARYRVFVEANMPGDVVKKQDQGHTFVVEVQADLTPIGATTAASPQFSWNRVSGAASYIIFINQPGSAVIETVQDPGSGSTVTHTISAALARNDYKWWVRPVRQVQANMFLGPWSDASEFSTGGRTRLTSPGRDGVVTTPTPTLTWSPVPGAVSYEVYVTEEFTPGILYRDAGISGNTVTARPLPGGNLKVWIRTTLANGTSVWGSGVEFFHSFTTTATSATPLTPDGPGFDTLPEFTWEPALASPSSYELLLHNGVASILRTGLTGTSHTETTPLTGGNWTWYVRPVHGGNFGNWRSRTFTTDGRTTLTSPAATTSDTTPTFTWNAVSGAVTYELQVDNRTTGTANVIREAGLVNPTYTPTNALTAGTYRAWVRAISSSTTGSWSVQYDFVVATVTPEVVSESPDTLLALLSSLSQEVDVPLSAAEEVPVVSDLAADGEAGAAVDDDAEAAIDEQFADIDHWLGAF